MFDMVLSLVVELVPLLLGQLFRASGDSNLDSAAATPTGAPGHRPSIERNFHDLRTGVGLTKEEENECQ
jgi:hypothetical protein